jgi:3-oxoacid CoA-transferase B subunit
MGGAMDLVAGTKRVIIAMEHTAKGEAKILETCTLPLTGKGVVDTIVTDLAYMRIKDGKIVVEELAPGVSKDDVIAQTKAHVVFSPSLTTMKV